MPGSAHIPQRLRRAVAERALFLCEYCQLQQELCPEQFEIDHVLPRALEGRTQLDNLALACPVCNNAKRNQVAARDIQTGRWVQLFNPRLQQWNDHFRWSDDSGSVIGKTATGRITVDALEMNHPRVVRIRLLWAALDLHPPRSR